MLWLLNVSGRRGRSAEAGSWAVFRHAGVSAFGAVISDQSLRNSGCNAVCRS